MKTNRTYKLDKEERELLAVLERSDLEPVRNQKKEMGRLLKIARATLRKNKNINIRVSEPTLRKLKAKAAEKGLPYQTLISSILHQYSNR